MASQAPHLRQGPRPRPPVGCSRCMKLSAAGSRNGPLRFLAISSRQWSRSGHWDLVWMDAVCHGAGDSIRDRESSMATGSSARPHSHCSTPGRGRRSFLVSPCLALLEKQHPGRAQFRNVDDVAPRTDDPIWVLRSGIGFRTDAVGMDLDPLSCQRNMASGLCGPCLGTSPFPRLGQGIDCCISDEEQNHYR